MPFLTLATPEVYSLKPRIISREFTIGVEAENRVFSGSVWHSRASSGSRPLLMIGHQETEDRSSPELRDLMKLMCGKYGFVVAIIDGPFHGSRGLGITDPQTSAIEFAVRWRDDEEFITQTALDWKLTLDALCELTEVDARYIGYFGLSMGTAYGIETVAKDLRISAAVFGNWGLPIYHQDRMTKSLGRINCPVEFYAYQKANSLQEQEVLFEQIRSTEKEFITYPKENFYKNSKTIERIKDFFVLHLLDKYLY
jgi:cephalosporin-C deacetylase-like acetyl esterase